MQNEKISEGLELIGSGFLALAEAFGKKVSSPAELEDAAHAASQSNGATQPKTEKKTKKEKPAVEAKTEAKEEKGSITEDQLRNALVEFAQENSKDEAYAILGKYGAKKVNELKKEDFPRVLAELEM